MGIFLSHFGAFARRLKERLTWWLGILDQQSFGASSIRLSFASPVRLSRKDRRNLFIFWLGLQHLDNFSRYGLIVVSSWEGLCLRGGCDLAGLFLVQD